MYECMYVHAYVYSGHKKYNIIVCCKFYHSLSLYSCTMVVHALKPAQEDYAAVSLCSLSKEKHLLSVLLHDYLNMHVSCDTPASV